MKIGDIVFHECYGLGVINRISYIGIIEIEFSGSSHSAAVENLTVVVENNNSNIKRCSQVIISLWETMKDDFLQADLFFKNSCVDIISIQDYEKIKSFFLVKIDEWLHLEKQLCEIKERKKQEALRCEAEEKRRQERIKQEALQYEAERQQKIKQEGIRRRTEKRRQQEQEKQDALQREAEAKRNQLLIALRKVLRNDFDRADSFFEASCKDCISINEYNQEKTSFLEALRREAKQKEQEKQEALRREAKQQEQEKKEALRREAEAKRAELFNALRKLLKDDFLQADTFFNTSCAGHISSEEYQEEKILFTHNWVKETTSTELDAEQATAVASVHGHIQVVARAGSGKTTTLVNRALFLQKHCGVAPDEIFLLAFNRKAAEEVAGRLSKTLDDCIPHVMTFHALAYAVVHPEESLLYNGPPGESQGLSRAFQQVVDDHLKIPVFKAQIRELMLAHFRQDWDRIIQGGYDKSQEELLQFRRSLPRESLGGDDVKSFGEKAIADFLFEHDVAYRYERNHWWNGINYRPDFTLFKTAKSGVIIEYFGLTGDPDYDEMSQAKRGYWNHKPDWVLLEFSPQDITAGGIENFRELLKQSLEEKGIPCCRLSEDEIWSRIRDRAIDRFTKVSVNFVGRCRKRWLTLGNLDELIARYKSISTVEDLFLKIARKLYEAYLERLVATGEDDFDGLMQRAAETVSKGMTVFKRRIRNGDIKNLRYVFIDEFQDFSELFYRLIVAMRKQNPQIELFCVGDDWQAINGFAGSDLKFFQNFEKHFDPFHKLYISTNYRSPQSIVR